MFYLFAFTERLNLQSQFIALQIIEKYSKCFGIQSNQAANNLFCEFKFVLTVDLCAIDSRRHFDKEKNEDNIVKQMSVFMSNTHTLNIVKSNSNLCNKLCYLCRFCCLCCRCKITLFLFLCRFAQLLNLFDAKQSTVGMCLEYQCWMEKSWVTSQYFHLGFSYQSPKLCVKKEMTARQTAFSKWSRNDFNSSSHILLCVFVLLENWSACWNDSHG